MLTNVPGLGMIWAILIWVFLWIQVEEKDDNSEKWLSVPVIVAAVSSLIIFFDTNNKNAYLLAKK